MKLQNLSPTRLLVATACSLLTFSATAASGASGYLTDNTGKVVTGNFGDCVQTGAWQSALSTPECDAALAARLEAERLEAERLAAEKARQLAALEAPAAIKKPVLVRLSDDRKVVFGFDSASLDPTATGELERALKVINAFESIDSIEITGHTDSSGPASYNQALSERRAASVRDFLASRGVASGVMTAIGQGEASPVTDNASRDGRARNRRVDIRISGDKNEE